MIFRKRSKVSYVPCESWKDLAHVVDRNVDSWIRFERKTNRKIFWLTVCALILTHDVIVQSAKIIKAREMAKETKERLEDLEKSVDILMSNTIEEEKR